MDFRTNPPAAARQNFSQILYVVALYSKYNRALTFSEFLSGNNIMEKAPKLEVPSRLGRKGAGYACMQVCVFSPLFLENTFFSFSNTLGRKGAGYACMQVCVQEGAVFIGPRVWGFERVEWGSGGEGVSARGQPLP
jgi:hypothetical protein